MNESPGKPQLPMFQITSDPLPMNPQMFTALGEAVVHWGRIETALDQDIADMRKWGIVRKLSKVVPHTFSKKLELWRRSVRTLYGTIDTYQQYADEFESAAKKVAKVRNHLIHGTWTLKENESGQFLVSNFRSVRGQERYDTLWVGQQEADNLLHDVKMLSSMISGFTISKMLHAHHKLLRATPSSLPSHPARLSPANPETQTGPPESSGRKSDHD